MTDGTGQDATAGTSPADSPGTTRDDHAPGPQLTRGTGGWIYLGLLTVVAVALAVAAYGFDQGSGNVRPVSGSLEPVELTLRVDQAVVALEGRVPAPPVRDQLVELAAARYGAPNVTDALVIDDSSSLDGGVVRVVGSVIEGDPDALGLQGDIVSAFMLRSGPVDLRIVPGPPIEAGASVAMDPGAD